jgi:hypothetical protein
VSVVLVGVNKTDSAVGKKRVVTEQMGRQRAEELGAQFCECSATTNDVVDADVLLLLVAAMQTSWQRPAGMAAPAHVPSEALLAQLFPPPPVVAATAEPTSSGTDAPVAQSWCVLQ